MSGAGRVRLLIGTEFLNEGGVGRQIHYLVNHLDPERFEIHLAILRDRDLFFTDLLDDERVRAVLVNGGRGVGLRGLAGIVRLFRSLRPDIVHLFGGKANHIGGFASIFSPVPVLIFSVRSVTSSRVNDVVYRLLRSRQNLTIVNSEGARKELTERSGYGEEEVRVQHNFLDTGLFRPLEGDEREEARRRFGVAPGRFCFASVGRIAPQKNQLATLEALHRLREEGRLPDDVDFLFVGREYNRRYARRARERCAALSLDALCRFHDPVRDVVPLYNALDGLFQPSTYEGLSNVVIEAQACGTPVALSAEGDNDGLVVQGKTGVSFRANHAGETVRALGDLIRLARDAEARKEITSRARAAVVERFSLEGEIGKLRETYERLLKEHGR
jgi:glycosyltransferase involved in cell wall biosynthesis